MAETAPLMQYLVAFNNNATDDPTLITTVATPPGTLGANNVWTDISRYVTNDDGVRGRMHEMNQFEAGTRQLTLINNDGRFTPWNASGPYTGLLVPRKPVQVRCTWLGVTYYRFTGQVDSWQPQWPAEIGGNCLLHATDAFRMFNLADLTTSGYQTQLLTYIGSSGSSGYWQMSDPAGSTVVADLTGFYPGHWYGTPTFAVAGPFPANPATATTLGTSSTASAYAALPRVLNLNLDMSVGSWVQITAAPPANSIILVFFDVSTGTRFNLFVNTSGFASFLGTAGTTIAGSTNLCDGNWHSIVGTCTAAGAAVLYVDGASVATTTAFNAAAAGTYGVIGGSALGVLANYGNLAQVFAANNVLTGANVTTLYNLAAFPQESTGTRVGRVLTSVGWAGSTARALDAGVSTVQAQTSALTTTSALSHMQSVEATEGGALFMSTKGVVTFYSRDTMITAAWTTASQATFGDNTAGGDIPFQLAPIMTLDDINLFNEASAVRTGGVTQITDNNTSIASYGRNTWNPAASLIGISDGEVLNLTQYIVNRYSTPVTRLAQIVIDLASAAADLPSTIPGLLTLDLLYEVTVERTIMPGGGTAFTQIGDIEQITESLDASTGAWTITFQLAPPDMSYWVLGTSQLGGTGTLADALYW